MEPSDVTALTGRIDAHLAAAERFKIDRHNDADYELLDDARTSIGVLTAEVDRLSTLVARLLAIPGEHRDEFLDQFADDDLAIPEARRDAVRDTCDVLGHKLRAAADGFPSRPCPTCGSRSRLVRRIPSPTDADYRNGSFNDPDYDPKFSNPCTDPWHEET